MEIAIRLGIALLIAMAGIGLYWAFNRARLASLQRAHQQPLAAGLEEFRSGVPGILYFTTPDCAPCRTIQGPAIEELRAQFGERLQIIKADATERMDLANQWGVLSVPTTFIIDAQGQPRHVNNGVTSASKLRQQLREYTNLSEPLTATTPVANKKCVTHS